MGGTWRIGGIADYWSKMELGYHVATTQNHRDAIETVELARAETERLHGRPLLEPSPITRLALSNRSRSCTDG